MSKNILITGASGMLGKDLVDIFSNDKNYQVFALSRKKIEKNKKVNFIQFDLGELKKIKIMLDKIKPDIIIHAAALVNVDECENNRKAAKMLHVEAAKILAKYRSSKIKFIYISTDSVFDGRKGGYLENDKANPLNYYAFSKLQGEREALKNNINSLIIRTNIYGFHVPIGKSLVENALNSLDKNEFMNGFQDVIFNPVYTKHLAIILKKIIERKKNQKGILNISNDDVVSKYDFLIKLAKIFKKKYELIKPDYIENAKLKALRPKNTSLNNIRLKKIIYTVPSLSQGLKDLKKDYKSNL